MSVPVPYPDLSYPPVVLRGLAAMIAVDYAEGESRTAAQFAELRARGDRNLQTRRASKPANFGYPATWADLFRGIGPIPPGRYTIVDDLRAREYEWRCEFGARYARCDP